MRFLDFCGLGLRFSAIYLYIDLSRALSAALVNMLVV